jgi:hypothetical protein
VIVYVIMRNGWDLDRAYYTYVCSVHRTKEGADRECSRLNSERKTAEDRYDVEGHEVKE